MWDEISSRLYYINFSMVERTKNAVHGEPNEFVFPLVLLNESIQNIQVGRKNESHSMGLWERSMKIVPIDLLRRLGYKKNHV